MARPLTEEQIARFPRNGDYRDWVLFVASTRNWVFARDDYAQEAHKIQKKNGYDGALARIDLATRELEDAKVLIKRAHGRTYDVTNDGRERFYNGEFTKGGTGGIYFSISSDKKDRVEPKEEPTQETNDEQVEDQNSSSTEQEVIEDDYTTKKLNRTAYSIEEVDSKLTTTNIIIAIASGVSAIAIVVQVCLSIFGTTTIDGEIGVLPREELLDSLRTQLKQTNEELGLSKDREEILKKERQNQAMILDSTYRKLSNVEKEKEELEKEKNALQQSLRKHAAGIVSK